MNNKVNRSIYFWNFAGNIAAAAVSILYLIIVSRYTSASDADNFSLAYAIGNLWIVIGMFQVRNYQATDLKETYSYLEYWLTRVITVCLMLVTLFPYLLFSGNNVEKGDLFLIIFLTVLYRSCDAFSDLFQGLFQQHERLDIAGKLMVLRYGSSTIILLISLLLSNSLIFSLICLCFFNVLFVYGGDYVQSKQIRTIPFNQISYATFKQSISIMKTCLPLFVNGFLLVYVLNYPKQVIDKLLVEGVLREGAQRDFSILFMPVFFMSLFVLALRPLITDLAKQWSEKRFHTFNAMIRKILLLLMILGLVVSILAYLIGIPILNIISGIDLSNYSLLLTILVLSGFLYSIASVIGDFLIILRKQVYLLYVYIAMALLTNLLTPLAMREFGLFGAGLSFVMVMLFYTVASWIVFVIMRRKEIQKYESVE